jgi:hypothetical protein
MTRVRNMRRIRDEIAVERTELLGKDIGMRCLGKLRAIDNFWLWRGRAMHLFGACIGSAAAAAAVVPADIFNISPQCKTSIPASITAIPTKTFRMN